MKVLRVIFDIHTLKPTHQKSQHVEWVTAATQVCPPAPDEGQSGVFSGPQILADFYNIL